MISWGARRQLSILVGFVLLIGAAVGVLFYTLAPDSTCFDGKKGRTELGIDCGGSCRAVCEDEVADVLVRWSKVIPVSSGQYDVAAFITNPNDRFVVGELRYTFKVFDENNILITERSGRTYVGPRDEFVIYEPRVNTAARTPRRTSIIFEDPPWERIETVPGPTVFVRNQQFESSRRPLITAEVVNSGNYEQRNLEVSAVLMEADRNVFAVSRTVIDVLAPQGSQQLLFSWPQQFSQQPAFIELYPHYIREGLSQD